ncbi:MAG TPA: hypothetical protein VGI39_06510 [Polyangiaceae bacterium]|jgi:hypothetical protein
MRAPALASLACLLAISVIPRAAAAEDTVHACIAASTDGQTLRKQGKLGAARERLLECARDACPAIVRSHCAKWLAEVEDRIPSIVVHAQTADGGDLLDAELTIDGHPSKLDGRPVSLDPGTHALSVSTTEGQHQDAQLLLVEGERARLVAIRFPSRAKVAATAGGAPSGEVPPLRTSTSHGVPLGAWILGGAGVVALGSATYFFVTAGSDLDTLNRTCSPHCTDAQAQPGRTDALLGDVFLAGGIAAVGGAVLWAALGSGSSHSPAASSAPPRLHVAPLAGGGAFASLTGTY